LAHSRVFFGKQQARCVESFGSVAVKEMKTVIDLSDNVKEYATSVKLLKIKKLLLCATFIKCLEYSVFVVIIKNEILFSLNIHLK
jgi:hypothetical protein